MICPKLSDLPSPPVGKTGWPWTEESERVFSVESGETLPKISIVTPTYNQSNYIEETIRSVLLQGYPDLEYIICDGGSPDGTVEILKKYSPWISFWVSEPDNGQSDAINKGFKRSTGDIAAWINSDDLYEKGAFNSVAQAFIRHPDYGLFYGDCLSFSDAGRHSILVRPHKTYSRKLLLQGQYFQQPSAFFNRVSLAKIGYINEDFHFCMDYDLFFRLCEGYAVTYIPETLARFRYQAESKTVSQNYKFLKEIIIILDGVATTYALDEKCMDVVLTRMFWSGIKLMQSGVENLDPDRRGGCDEEISDLSPEDWLRYLVDRVDTLRADDFRISSKLVRDIYSLFSIRYTQMANGMPLSICGMINRTLEVWGYQLLQRYSSKHAMPSEYAVSILTYYPDMIKYRRSVIVYYLVRIIFLKRYVWIC